MFILHFEATCYIFANYVYLFQAYVHCYVAATVFMAVVSVIASTAGRVLSVMWSRPIAFNQTVMVMDAAGKGFAFACQGGQEKIATLVSYPQLMRIITLQNLKNFVKNI